MVREHKTRSAQSAERNVARQWPNPPPLPHLRGLQMPLSDMLSFCYVSDSDRLSLIVR